jgi:3-methyl-2-oxobutanoate hydroxymethyltransferase
MSTTLQDRKKVTTLTFRIKKKEGQPITVMTAYDYSSALLVDKAGVDCILVGDSLGMVVLGYENTLPVTMEDMLHHSKAVSRGASNALLVADMPFMSYQISVNEAVRHAGRFLQEAGMDAVKLEGGQERCDAIRAIVQTGIPVMGHIGLTPQSVHQLGGFRTQGKTADAAYRLLEDAMFLEEAGCFSIVLESIPDRVATCISQKINIPTIGIGAGSGCDGQVLVYHDILGLFDRFKPKFVKTYIDLNKEITNALISYKEEVETRSFPDLEHSFQITEENWQSFLKMLEK